MPFTATDYDKAVQICKDNFKIDNPKEHAFLVIAVYKAISIRQIEKRLVNVINAFKNGSSPAGAVFTMDDFQQAVDFCENKFDIKDLEEHPEEFPFVITAMYEAIGFRQIEERIEELISEARKVRNELNSLKSRADQYLHSH
ncbi:MAG: hypothetical protein DWQ02_06710 [Bacteroidetes bacterium]|nr:MAG: hypothetical protein DWQ02_06710 [Bacteroidota bacterium]